MSDLTTRVRAAYDALMAADPALNPYVAAVVREVPALLAEVERLTPRKIETVAELQQLPHGAIVLGARGSAWEHEIHNGWHYWHQTGSSSANCGDPDIPLPALVLWAGGVS